MKYIFVDIEANPRSRRIYQLSMIYFDGSIAAKHNHETEGLRIKNGTDLSPAPLLDNDLTRVKEWLSDRIDPFDKRDKAFFVGFNSGPDYTILKRWFGRAAANVEGNDHGFFGSYFMSPPLCLLQSALMQLREERFRMSDFQFPTVCEELDIEFDLAQWHDAEYDNIKALELFIRLEGLNGRI